MSRAASPPDLGWHGGTANGSPPRALNRATVTAAMKVGRRARRLVILDLFFVIWFFLWPTVGVGTSLTLATLAALTHTVRSRHPTPPSPGQG